MERIKDHYDATTSGCWLGCLQRQPHDRHLRHHLEREDTIRCHLAARFPSGHYKYWEAGCLVISPMVSNEVVLQLFQSISALRKNNPQASVQTQILSLQQHFGRPTVRRPSRGCQFSTPCDNLSSLLLATWPAHRNCRRRWPVTQSSRRTFFKCFSAVRVARWIQSTQSSTFQPS